MNKFVGLEFNSSCVTLAYLELQAKRWRLINCGQVKFDPAKSDALEKTRVLRILFKDVDLLDTKIISTVNSPYLVVREFIFPYLNSKELLEAVRWKVKDCISFPSEEAIIDFKIIGRISEGQSSKLKVLAVAIPQDVVMRHIDIFKSAGIMPSMITIVPLAFESLLAHWKGFKDTAVTALNVGRDMSIMSIYKERKLEFTRMITSKIERLPLDVRLSLDYFIEESHGTNVEKIILFAEEENLERVVDSLRQHLSVPVIAINPLRDSDISYDKVSLKDKNNLLSSQQIAISLGAALSYDKGINILPEKIKRLPEYYLICAGSRFVAILGSFIFLFIYLNLQFHIQGFKERAMAAEAELETLEPLIKEIEPIENLYKQVGEYVDLAKTLLARRKVWSEILREISTILPESVTLSDLNVEKDTVVLKGSILSLAQSPAEVILSGFIVSLEKGIFKNVSLVTAQKYEEQGVLEFSLNTQLDL